MRVAAEIALSKEERRKLENWASTRSTSVRLIEATTQTTPSDATH